MKQLTLKHFILKQRVLDLYRYAIRSSRGEFLLRAESEELYMMLLGIPDPTSRKETIAWIRGEFERNRHIEDLVRLPLLKGKVHALTALSRVSLKTRSR